MNRAVSWFCKIFVKPVVDKFLIKEVKGIKNIPKNNFILASNHQSHLDWIASGYLCVPRRFTFIGQVDRYKGVLGWGRNLLYLIAGVIPLNRKDENSKIRALSEAASALKKGDILIIYPEGTRSRTGQIQKGRWGVAKIFLKSGVLILPTAFIGTFELMPPGGKLKIKRTVNLIIGKPLYFKEEFEKAKNLDCQSTEYQEILKKITERIMREITLLKEGMI